MTKKKQDEAINEPKAPEASDAAETVTAEEDGAAGLAEEDGAAGLANGEAPDGALATADEPDAITPDDAAAAASDDSTIDTSGDSAAVISDDSATEIPDDSATSDSGDSAAPSDGAAGAPSDGATTGNEAPQPLQVTRADDIARAAAKTMERPVPTGLPPGALGVVSAPKTDAEEAKSPEPPATEAPVEPSEPISIAAYHAARTSGSETSSRRALPRQVSVFHRAAPPPVSKEQHYEQAHHLHEEDDIPIRSPLSSLPFFMWGGLTLFLALVLAIFLTDLAKPLLRAMDSQLQHNLHSFINSCTRSAGMLLAAVITLCAIAIPLTANNYTSKLLNLFTNSKVNRGMFALLILTNLFNMVAMLFFSTTGPWPLIEVAVVGMLTFSCFVMVIPYAFYIFHFLQPDEIVRHIEREVMDDLMAVKDAGNGPSVEIYRKRIIQNLKNLSNIALRSVDRHDRDTAMLSLEALRHIIHHYFAFKGDMPSQWFRVSRMYFLSLSGEMRRRVEQGKTFLEAEVMEEFALVLGSTFGKLRDMVRMIARTVRHIGVEADEAEMPAVLELTSLYFNTFLRAAISRREPEAVYMIVYHYRRMAEEMMPTNEFRPGRVAFYLSYYGQQSVRSGMVFVANLVSSDLAHMAAVAFEINAPSKEEVFEIFLAFGEDENIRDLPGVIKSRFKLAVLLHHLGFDEEQDRLLTTLARRPKEALTLGVQDIGKIKTPMFWEVTDRHRHNDYLAPALFRSFAQVKARLFPKESHEEAV